MHPKYNKGVVCLSDYRHRRTEMQIQKIPEVRPPVWQYGYFSKDEKEADSDADLSAPRRGHSFSGGVVIVRSVSFLTLSGGVLYVVGLKLKCLSNI